MMEEGRRQLTRERIEAVRARSPVEAVIGSYIRLRRTGRRFTGLCPFHDDRRPSLVVYPASQSWYCFGCGAHGDVFDFVQRMENLSFREAVERLSTGELQPRPVARPAPAREEAPPAPLTEEHFALLTAAADAYHATLLATPAALEYLRRRGVDADAVRRHRLGYASGRRLVPYLRFRGWDPALAADLGLIGPQGEFFRRRVLIPEIRGGRVIHMVGRAIRAGREPKYLSLPGAPKPIYGADLVKGSREVFITEGPFDWITLVGWGYTACCLGGTWLKPEDRSLFDEARRIYLCLDIDEAGQRLTRELMELWGARVRPIPHLKGVKDVNELAQRPDGRDLFARLVKLADQRARERSRRRTLRR